MNICQSMKNDTKYIDLGDIALNYRVLGNGHRKLIAFHGFGQNCNAFLPLSDKDLGFTIYSIDLPFHGNTRLNKNLDYLNKDVIVALIDRLIHLESLLTFSLIGFSIGAHDTIHFFFHDQVV